LADVAVTVLLAPGLWHDRLQPVIAGDGRCAVEFTPPRPGAYYVYVHSRSLGLEERRTRTFVLDAQAVARD